jgi:hypothetical protein
MAQSDDAETPAATGTAVADVSASHNVGKPEVREMPAEPKPYWRPCSAAERLSPWIW